MAIPKMAPILKAVAGCAALLAGCAAAAAAPRSCHAEIGSRAAQVLVRRCISVSPATHPPCNALNPCALIREEIARSCAMIASNRPHACRGHPVR
jgi:hypothetical protein